MEQKNILIIVIAIILTAVVAGGGIYYWQSSGFKTERLVLQGQIDSLERQIEALRSQLDLDKKCPAGNEDKSVEAISFGDYFAYTVNRNEKSLMILCKDGQEVIVDEGLADFENMENDVNQMKRYENFRFSPKGNYLLFGAGRWEWSTSYIYDIRNNKLVHEIDLSSGSFTPNEDYYYECLSDGMSTGQGIIYKAPSFDVEYDISNERAKMNLKEPVKISCSYSSEKNSIEFIIERYEGAYFLKGIEYSLTDKKVTVRDN